jgi:hypothetical protein
MKIKTADEDRDLVDNMSSNEYHLHTEEETSPRNKCMIDLNTHDALLLSNQLFSIQLETIEKRLNARDATQTFNKCDL